MPSDDISRAGGGSESSRESSSVRLVLGSGSPRRRELLAHLGRPFDIVSPDIDEDVRPGEDPLAYVGRLAVEKAAAVRAVLIDDADAGVVIVAADTTVEIDGRILAKPEDAADARRMLEALAGRAHRVHTGLAVGRGDRIEHTIETTSVHFRSMTTDEIEWYVATGEPFGKAGAYAIQGAGGLFVDRVEGSVSNVVGLPLTRLVELLARVGVTPTRD